MCNHKVSIVSDYSMKTQNKTNNRIVYQNKQRFQPNEIGSAKGLQSAS